MSQKKTATQKELFPDLLMEKKFWAMMEQLWCKLFFLPTTEKTMS